MSDAEGESAGGILDRLQAAGPLQFLVIEFDEPQYKEDVRKRLYEAAAKRGVRILSKVLPDRAAMLVARMDGDLSACQHIRWRNGRG